MTPEPISPGAMFILGILVGVLATLTAGVIGYWACNKPGRRDNDGDSY